MQKIEDRQKLPPMLRSYLEYKDQYPHCLMLFQVGDFYESFFDDAVLISKTLNLTLTSRDKSAENPTPMCGVPIAVVDNYLGRLVSAGFAVAVVSQESQGVDNKTSVTRRLERIVTPGVRILEHGESTARETVLAAIYIQSELEVAIAHTEVQTGIVWIRDAIPFVDLIPELLKIAPSELIIPRVAAEKEISRKLQWVRRLESQLGKGAVIQFRNFDLGSSSHRRNISGLQGYSSLSNAGKGAVKLLLSYVDEVTVSSTLSFREVIATERIKSVSIDATTRANLELVRNIKDGSLNGTFLWAIDRTLTRGGHKLLRSWLVAPLMDVQEIIRRQEVVRFFKENSIVREKIRKILNGIVDFERLAVRCELKVASPRELGALRDSIQLLPEIVSMLKALAGKLNLITSIIANLELDLQLTKILAEALVESPPNSLLDGDIFKDGFNIELDRLRKIRTSGAGWIAEMETAEKRETGISSLKIRFNRVFGYFIEVTSSNLGKVPPHYIRKQTTANGERYVTEELKNREEEILSAQDKQIILEKTLYDQLRSKVTPFISSLCLAGEAISLVDTLAALGELADMEGYVAPILDDSKEIFIRNGKHPVLTRLIGSDYIPNSLSIGDNSYSCFVITGPNMGGKSTYLRQTALITILAQIGSFVPAQEVKIGIVDKIFARIGASDNMAEGESTFMVEMKEAAHIVSNATPRSLLLIDEIGRGTATTDGLSIAQSILEWIVTKLNCRTLFATHFHELIYLSKMYHNVGNLSVTSIERGDDVIFTHRISEGAASKSYGIEVARLAGLPEDIILRARKLLASIDEISLVAPELRNAPFSSEQLSLFEPKVSSQPRHVIVEKIVEPPEYPNLLNLRARIEAIDLNNLTPLQALNLVSDLTEKVGKKHSEG